MTPREVRNGPVAEALLLLPAKMTSPQAELKRRPQRAGVVHMAGGVGLAQLFNAVAFRTGNATPEFAILDLYHRPALPT